ncbi:hypothetical protein [Nostoc sp. CHAB 5715]|uniref:hypothetical protein n=1 Tax=Nostoc sp. CHAB 5715 TaxID=2780400 RepID=UPI001E480D27|nr:hypothetical protein [Nostoc sp. CHAB 5715]MCC5622881.1 hypothetical protein [Nostoc sp. CHAB 5715]
MTPYLSTVTVLGITEAEAGTRAQSDDCYGLTLVLMGSSHGETESKKATHTEAGHNTNPPTLLEIIPATF